MKLGKGGLSHDALAHDSACDAHHAAVLRCSGLADVVAFLVLTDDRQVLEVVDDVGAPCRHGVFGGRIRVNAHLSQLLQTLTSADFLFAQF